MHENSIGYDFKDFLLVKLLAYLSLLCKTASQILLGYVHILFSAIYCQLMVKFWKVLADEAAYWMFAQYVWLFRYLYITPSMANAIVMHDKFLFWSVYLEFRAAVQHCDIDGWMQDCWCTATTSVLYYAIDMSIAYKLHIDGLVQEICNPIANLRPANERRRYFVTTSLIDWTKVITGVTSFLH